MTATGARRIFSAAGLPAKPIHDVRWRNVTADGQEAGTIEWARDWVMTNVALRTADGSNVRVANSERVALPTATKR